VRREARLPALIGSALLVTACAFDWGSLDPREATSSAGGQGGTDPTTSSSTTASGGGGGGSTTSSSTGAGGTGGTGGTGGASTGVGGAGGNPLETCVDFCVTFYGCQPPGTGGGGFGGGLPEDQIEQLCAQECMSLLDRCSPSEQQALLACMDMVDDCSDVDDFQSCAATLTCD